MKRNRVWEAAKTALMILLIISALFLGGKTGLFRGISTASLSGLFSILTGGGGGENPGTARPPGGEGADLPMCMSVTALSETGHYGVKNNAQAMELLYGKAAMILREAMGTSQIPQEVGEAQWRGAITGPGIYFDFLTPLPVSIFAGWLGTEIGHAGREAVVRRMAVAVMDKETFLYYVNEADGGFYRCATAVPESGLAAIFEEYLPNGAVFAFEKEGEYDGVDLYSLILPGSVEGSRIESVNPLSGQITDADILAQFEIYNNTPTRYPDGTIMYGEGERVLKIFPDGQVTYWRLDVSGASAMNQAGNIEAAWSLISGLMESGVQDAGIRLSGIESDGREGYILKFLYFVDGLPVYVGPEGWAAQIALREGVITEAHFILRSYHLTEQKVSLLPERQALSILTEHQGGGELLLCYIDNGAGGLSPTWSRYRP